MFVTNLAEPNIFKSVCPDNNSNNNNIIIIILSLPWVPRSDHLDFPFKLGPTGSFEAIISLCLYLVLAVFTAVFLDGLVIF